MDQQILSSRAVLGMYFARLENPVNAGWIDGISNLFGSDQASEHRCRACGSGWAAARRKGCARAR
jgi:hypothetical protein